MGVGKKKPETNGEIPNGKEAHSLLENGATEPAQNGSPRTHKDSETSVGTTGDLTSADDFVPEDGGWGWVVCLASFWTNGTVFGILNTFGILFAKMSEVYDDGTTTNLAFKISWIGGLQIFLTFFLSPVASILVDRIGIRATGFIGAAMATLGMLASSFVRSIELMYLTYGVMLGAGSSLIYNPSLVILGHYFKDKLGIVNGLVSFGSAVFTIILPFLLNYLVESIGLFWTMRVEAALLALLMLGSLSWIPKYQAKHTELDHYLKPDDTRSVKRCSGCVTWVKKFLNVRIWRNRGYCVWAIAFPVAFLGYFVPFVHLVKHVNDTIPGSNPAILVMCIGVTSGVSRIVFGLVADLPNVNRIRMQQFSFLVLGVMSACIPLSGDKFWPLIVITLVMGIADGCFICLIGPIAFDLLGSSGAAQGIGCVLGLASIPMTAGPPLAGLMYDQLGSYDIAFYCGGVPPIIAALLLFLIPARSKSKQAGPAVSMAKTMVAMSMENLDRIGEDPDDLSSFVKPQFVRYQQDEGVRSARSWTVLPTIGSSHQKITTNSRLAVSLHNLGPRKSSMSDKKTFICTPSPLARDRKTSEPTGVNGATSNGSLPTRKASSPVC